MKGGGKKRKKNSNCSSTEIRPDFQCLHYIRYLYISKYKPFYK